MLWCPFPELGASVDGRLELHTGIHRRDRITGPAKLQDASHPEHHCPAGGDGWYSTTAAALYHRLTRLMPTVWNAPRMRLVTGTSPSWVTTGWLRSGMILVPISPIWWAARRMNAGIHDPGLTADRPRLNWWTGCV